MTFLKPIDSRPDELFVTCAPSLEPFLIQELEELGYKEAIAGYRGVYVRYEGMEQIYRINYCSRLASRVLLPLLKFPCRDKDGLYKAVRAFDWPQYLNPKRTFAIDFNVSHPKLTNSLFAAQIAKDAIVDSLREKFNDRPSIDIKEPDVQLNLFIHGEKAILSFDTSGPPLHKRGYRMEAREAPIQETIAALIAKLAQVDKEGTIVLDPCMGSGTLLIEAALLKARIPPGFLRKLFGFMFLPSFDNQKWLEMKADVDSKRRPLNKGEFFGFDKDPLALKAMKANLKASGMLQYIHVTEGDFRAQVIDFSPNCIIANPPHGKRLEDEESLVTLYRALGDLMKMQTKKPARGFVFTTSMLLSKEIGLKPKQRHVLSSGGLDARLLEYDLYS